MRQQLLDLELPPRFAYSEWVRHHGVEAAQNRLALWLVHGGRLWLTSETPSGKTHLAHLLAAEYPHLGLIRVQADSDSPATQQVNGWLEILGNCVYWLIDVPAGALSQSTGIALFHLLERAREMERSLVLFWRYQDADDAPAEFITRLATLERIEMQPPHTDADLTAVLQAVATSRQWQVDDSVIQLMLTYLPRDLDTLVTAMQQMEQASLAERKRLTKRWASRQISRLGDNMAGQGQSKLF